MNANSLINSLLQAKLELQHESTLEQFCFTGEGCVVATLGAKKGPVYGPVLNYRVTEDDVVEIFDHKGTIIYRWEQLQMQGELLKVVCKGKPKTFSVTRPL